MHSTFTRTAPNLESVILRQGTDGTAPPADGGARAAHASDYPSIGVEACRCAARQCTRRSASAVASVGVGIDAVMGTVLGGLRHDGSGLAP